MSLYNLVHGVNPAAAGVLHHLNLRAERIERFRDARITRLGGAIVLEILCRTGGNNRQDFPNKGLVEHSQYIKDLDDAFDETYAHYYFHVPDKMREEIATSGVEIENLVDEETLQEKFESALERLRSGAVI